jgi:hydrogenase nickel incorporation protein HypA/HybF
MHELSIAHSLVETAVEAAERAGARRVTRVLLRLGALSGVVRNALEFGYEITTQGTLLEGSELVIEELPVIVDCDACHTQTTLHDMQGFACPACGAPGPRMIQGRELELQSIEIDVDDAVGGDAIPEASHALPTP